MGYDEETLTQILKKIGFHITISRGDWGHGSVPDLSLLEKMDNPRKYESLILECIKPI